MSSHLQWCLKQSVGKEEWRPALIWMLSDTEIGSTKAIGEALLSWGRLCGCCTPSQIAMPCESRAAGWMLGVFAGIF